MSSKTERLQNWVDTLDIQTLKSLLVECVDELILAETVCFYDDTKVPYWDGNGENLDGSDRGHDDE